MMNRIVSPSLEGYTRPWFEYNSLLLEVIDMLDEHLIDEILDICYDSNEVIDKTIADWFNEDRDLTPDERMVLINYYILYHGEEGFEE